MKKENIMQICKDAYIDLCFDNLVDDSPYEIRMRNNYSTAAWAYRDGKNYIFIGDKILNGVKKDCDKEMDHYVTNYLFHEVSHSIHTEKEMGVVRKFLDRNDIPFSLFNLAEDARIEHLMREKTGRLFKWIDYEDHIDDRTPEAQLFLLIINEGVYEADKIIISFYERFCAAKDTFDLLGILLEWKKEFDTSDEDMNNLQNELKDDSDDEEEQKDGKPGPLEDLLMSILLQSDDAFEEAMRDSEVITGNTEPADKVEPGEDIEVAEFSSGNLLSKYYDDWDIKKARNLAEVFKKAFTSRKKKVKSRKAAKYINKKAFYPSSYSGKYYMSKEVLRASQKDVVLILDCSGSMAPIVDDMKIIVSIFSLLAELRNIKATLVLSGVAYSKAMAQTFELPISNDTIGKIDANFSAEGLDFTVEFLADRLKKADHVFVLTDGYICDRPIDREKYRKMGIFTIGFYIGARDVQLDEWFDKTIKAYSVESCVSELINIVKE